MLLAALAMIAVAAPTVQAQTLDKNGKCHDASGKFAKADVCKGVKGTTTAAAETAKRAPAATVAAAPAAAAKGDYKLDAKGKCRDAKGKMAKKTLCAA
jgi:hypothetical protein